MRQKSKDDSSVAPSIRALGRVEPSCFDSHIGCYVLGTVAETTWLSMLIRMARLDKIFHHKPASAQAANDLLPAVQELQSTSLTQSARQRGSERSGAIIGFNHSVAIRRTDRLDL